MFCLIHYHEFVTPFINILVPSTAWRYSRVTLHDLRFAILIFHPMHAHLLTCTYKLDRRENCTLKNNHSGVRTTRTLRLGGV